MVVGLAAHPAVGEGIGEDAELLDRAARHAAEARAVIDVGHLHAGGRDGRVDLRGDGRRLLGRLEGNRLEVGEVRLLGNRREVVEGVCEVEPPAVLLCGTRRHHHVVLGERVRVAELRPRVVGHAVAHDRLHGLATLREALHHALRLLAALLRIEENEFAVARLAVVPGDDGGEHVGRVRARTRVEEGVRPVGVAAVVGALHGAVGVHGEEDARHVVRDVGILPVQEHDAAVGHEVYAPVVVLVEREAADRAVRLAAIDARHPARSHHARHAHHRGIGEEKDRAVRQVAARVAVHVGVGDEGNLDGPRARCADVQLHHAVDRLHGAVAPHLRRLVRPVRAARVHRLLRVPPEADLADVAVGCRGVEDRELRRAAQIGKNAQLVRAAAEDVARLLPVVVEAEVGLPPADREQPVAVEERIGKEMRAQVVEELLSAGHRRQLAVERAPVALDRVEEALPARLERAQPLGILLEAVGPARAHVGPREAHILHLERHQSADDAIRRRLRHGSQRAYQKNQTTKYTRKQRIVH